MDEYKEHRTVYTIKIDVASLGRTKEESQFINQCIIKRIMSDLIQMTGVEGVTNIKEGETY